ncbi:MAG: hypothetical protein JST20_14490 [Bacteroidetes bacterium]|nr:hypothetical protein [Bacteroidota bacterium]
MKKFIILFVVLLSFGAVNTFAQCPPDSLPGASPYMGAWVKDSCVTIKVPKTSNPSDSCDWNVCYCYRVGGLTAPFVEVYVYASAYVDTCNPFNVTEDANLILGKEILKKNPRNHYWPCPPCDEGSGAPNRRIIVTGCRTKLFPYPSCNAGCCFYCAYDYEFCCDEDGTKHLTLVNSTTVGTGVCPSNCEIGPCGPG